MNEQSENHWHLRKEINLTHIAATVTVIVSLTAGYYDLRSDIEIVKARVSAQESRTDRSERRMENAMVEIRNSLRRIEEKLDGKKDK